MTRKPYPTDVSAVGTFASVFPLVFATQPLLRSSVKLTLHARLVNAEPGGNSLT